jgi:hypothetical protein
MSKKDKIGRKLEHIPEAIEGAFIAVLAQTAFLMSKPLMEVGQNGQITIYQLLIIGISLINFFNIAANWLSVRNVVYTRGHLFWDIITLAVFFVLSQTLYDSYISEKANIPFILLITSIFYVLISIVYIIWNNIEIENLKKSKSKNTNKFEGSLLKKANVRNYISLVIAVFLGGISIFISINWILLVAYAVWLLNWLYVIGYYIGDQRFWKD